MPPLPERLPAIPDSELTPAQLRAAEAVRHGRRGALFGPFVPLLRSPELLERTQRLGEYLRYDCALPAHLRELAILLTARHYRQSYEWHVHAPAALEAGLRAELIEEIAAGADPSGLRADEAAIHAFCTELHAQHAVSDETYARTRACLGEMGLVDLCGVCGYYALLALVMNVARTALPAGAREPWADSTPERSPAAPAGG